MKHLGDITKINGAEAPVVEVIIGGSPCQDLSVAGKRAGLDGERSGLFMEQIRVIREMREHDRAGGRTDELIRPRFMVWENVPGAFSSNKGEDFRTVLEETARVADETAVIPRPPKGKWTNAGAVMGNGWSIAWRVFDAQFWGVPQRRKRIALVADFGGHAAPEVLFEREGVQGHTDESGAQRERTAGDTETGADKAVVYGISAYESNAMKSGNPHSGVYVAETARTLDNNGGSPACNQGGMAVVQSSGFKYRIDNSGTAQTIVSKGSNAVCIGNGQPAQLSMSKKAGALNCMHDQQAVMIQSIVRRLTPLECERLQGYPDYWTHIGDWTDSKGKKHKDADSPKYKALGNSIALPNWEYVLSRLNAYCKEHTIASLFDGIGGFPLIWKRLNGRGSCLWASELEEFPMAVTKLRFGGEQ